MTLRMRVHDKEPIGQGAAAVQETDRAQWDAERASRSPALRKAERVRRRARCARKGGRKAAARPDRPAEALTHEQNTAGTFAA
jgi:hypothetical protein